MYIFLICFYSVYCIFYIYAVILFFNINNEYYIIFKILILSIIIICILILFVKAILEDFILAKLNIKQAHLEYCYTIKALKSIN